MKRLSTMGKIHMLSEVAHEEVEKHKRLMKNKGHLMNNIHENNKNKKAKVKSKYFEN